MPVHASFGVFPSQSAVRSKSTPEIQRLYFRTSQRGEYDWRTIPENDRPDNFADIHNLGKRTTKYMKFQKQTAPLLDRTACRYSSDYSLKPLGDYVTNNELAKTFRGDRTKAPSLATNAKTSYQETFPSPTNKQLKGARQKSCAPRSSRTKTLGGTGDLMETLSSCHRNYPTHPQKLVKEPCRHTPKSNLTMSSTYLGEMFRSSYNKDFDGYSSLAPAVRWEDLMPEQPPYVLCDDAVFRHPRAIYLSPGS